MILKSPGSLPRASHWPSTFLMPASSLLRQSAPAFANWSAIFIMSFTVTVTDPYTGSVEHVSRLFGTSIFWTWT